MFNVKRNLFLSSIILLVLVFASGCKKAEVYDFDLDNNESKVEDTVNVDEEVDELIEEEEEEDVLVKKPVEEEEEELKIVFEDLTWKTYNNNLLAYSIAYPTISNVMGNDLDQHVEFTGPLSNNEWWPRISVSHYSNTFYRPDSEASVAEWVKVSPEYKLGSEISIAGLETIHYIQEKTPQAWAADYYYFIKDNQLYNITIIHANDKQDWDLYNKVLESFSFTDTEDSEEVK